MRALTDEELTLFFQKLNKYIGDNIKYLVESGDASSERVFRLIKNRVYYISVDVLRQVSAFSRDQLLHCGTCFGQFSSSGKFRVSITALDFINKYAKAKVWLKGSGEQNFVYGNHILKAHIARISENAVKYSPADSIIEVSAELLDEKTRIKIADRGAGIPSEDLTRIFDKFYRVQRPENVSGTGLGLSISKGIVEVHHGTIYASTREGGGTIITIELPLNNTG